MEKSPHTPEKQAELYQAYQKAAAHLESCGAIEALLQARITLPDAVFIPPELPPTLDWEQPVRAKLVFDHVEAEGDSRVTDRVEYGRDHAQVEVRVDAYPEDTDGRPEITVSSVIAWLPVFPNIDDRSQSQEPKYIDHHIFYERKLPLDKPEELEATIREITERTHQIVQLSPPPGYQELKERSYRE